MKALIQYLSQSLREPIEAILIVGAGAGNDLPTWRELHGKHLFLAEAHPRLSEELAHRIEPSRGEEAWPLAIVAAPGQQAMLQVLNNPVYNSLLSPQGLVRHFPNLRVVNQTEVAARSLGESIDSLLLDSQRPHLLVLDAPGQAGALLEATPVRVLQSFTWIMVRCGIEPLYADEMGFSDVKTLLRGIGFDVLVDDPEAIYPQTASLFKRNDDRVRIRQLEAELHKRADEYAVQAKLVAQHQTDRDKVAQQAAEQQKLVADRDAQIGKLTQERDEQAKLAVRHKAESDQAAEQLAELQKLAADRHAQIQRLTQERDDQARLVNEQTTSLENLERQREESREAAEANVLALTTDADNLRANCDRLQRELQESRQTTSLSVRMQTLREADLKDLQARYQVVLEKNEEQYQLLAKLGERLRTAAGYFHQLAMSQSSENDAPAVVRSRKVPANTKPAENHSTGKRAKTKA
jgi:hypothetical protein